MKTRTEQADLLRSRIEASGLSARRFALEVLLREDRTIRRWLDGKSPIPKVVLAWLGRPKVAPWPRWHCPKCHDSGMVCEYVPMDLDTGDDINCAAPIYRECDCRGT